MGPGFLFEDEKSFDSLTQVYNREVLVSYINFLVAEKVPFSLAIVDVDNFKYISDTYGHLSGDKVLIEVAERLKEVVGEKGTVARFGGAEFLIVYPDIVAYEKIWQECRQILAIVNECEIHDVAGLFVSVTVGVSRFPENESSYEGLLETADKALYRGKEKGRNCFIIYIPEKHGDIELTAQKEKNLSSMYLHSIVFRLLNNNPEKEAACKTLFNFLSSYYELDHICLQKGNKIYFEKNHENAKNQSLVPINLDLLRDDMSASAEFFYINEITNLPQSNQLKLAEQYIAQNLQSAFCCRIDENEDGELFVLRAESESKREWQSGEMDVLITAAKIIEMLYRDKKLKL